MIFGFWSLFANNLHFARQDGQDGKKNHETKATKIPKTKKYGTNETLALNNLFKRSMSAGKANLKWVLFLCHVLLCDQNSFVWSKMVLFGLDQNDLVTTKMKWS